MAVKDKRRRARRDARQCFLQGVDATRLDYARRVQPLRGTAKMRGVLAAAGLYLAGFALGYLGWQQDVVGAEQFAKLAWILMVPATAVGAFVWLMLANRFEYPVREDIRHFMREREGDAGWLWCFAPLQEALDPGDLTAKKIMQQSRDRKVEMDPEDYANTALKLQQQLQQHDSHGISADIAATVLENLRTTGQLQGRS